MGEGEGATGGWGGEDFIDVGRRWLGGHWGGVMEGSGLGGGGKK